MEVRLKPHIMAHIQGIQTVIPGIAVKSVIDCILDAIVYSSGFKVAHQPKVRNESRKVRLSSRHLDYLTRYAAKRHVDYTTALNLLLDDYFSEFKPQTISNSYQESFSPTVNPKPTVSNLTTNTNTPHKATTKLKGASLLGNLKR